MTFQACQKLPCLTNWFSYPLSWGQGQETTDEDAVRDQLHPGEGKGWCLGWAQDVEHLAEEDGYKTPLRGNATKDKVTEIQWNPSLMATLTN